jgi:hypothetical protein
MKRLHPRRIKLHINRTLKSCKSSEQVNIVINWVLNLLHKKVIDESYWKFFNYQAIELYKEKLKEET